MATRTYGPGITYFVREFQILTALAVRPKTSLMLGGAIGLSHHTHAFKSAQGWLNRRGWIDHVNGAWTIQPPGQAYLDQHPMEV